MIEDFLGNELKEGDIVLRCKFSSFSFHKIEKFTKKRIQLSVRRIKIKGWAPNHIHEYVIDSVEINDLKNHNGFIYISNNNGLIKNLIKYNNIK